MDSSGSIIPADFEREKQFLIDIVNAFPNIGPTGVQVGLVRFSTDAQNMFLLGQFTNRNDIINAIRGVTQTFRQTDISKAFRLVRDTQLIPPTQDRPEAPNVAVIVTDGRQVRSWNFVSFCSRAANRMQRN